MRIISSCNVDPMEAVIARQLRDDLFYRLAVVYISIPPLRERIDDVEILAQHFIKVLNAQFDKKVKGLSPEVMQAFLKYNWPGNVRQLKNCIEGAMNAVTDGEDTLLPHHLPQYLSLSMHQNKYVSKAQQEYSSSTDIFIEIKQREKEEIIEALTQRKYHQSSGAFGFEQTKFAV